MREFVSKSKTEIEKHNKTTHEPHEVRVTIVNCGVCAENFVSEKDRLDHKKMHERMQMFECKLCRNFFKELVDLEWHVETEHEIKAVPKAATIQQMERALLWIGVKHVPNLKNVTL